jgi:oligoendopeptidase F
MNGVKGTMAILDKRRGRTDALHESLDMARIDRETLDAMMGAMRDSFPVFRKYLKAKAQRLGHEGGLPWWDLFAPIGETTRKYSWPETRAFLTTQFRTFSNTLADFTETAFDRNWIDAESRPGKRGGAFCMGVLGVQEPRILCNFDGSLDQVFTVAHELGHGYHFTLMRGKTPIQRYTPMTLNETASIFCETLITGAAMQQASSPNEELSILETFLQSATQVIVDISSRFQFEREVFDRRPQSELSADDFCEIMMRAQLDTYGDGLDERYLHPYMWAWKPHYYRAGLQFYNYPYAFGLLFGMGLFAIYQQRGAAFVPDYESLLAGTGLDTAANLAARFGIDIRNRKFWENSLNIIAARVDRYCEL